MCVDSPVTRLPTPPHGRAQPSGPDGWAPARGTGATEADQGAGAHDLDARWPIDDPDDPDEGALTRRFGAASGPGGAGPGQSERPLAEPGILRRRGGRLLGLAAMVDVAASAPEPLGSPTSFALRYPSSSVLPRLAPDSPEAAPAAAARGAAGRGAARAPPSQQLPALVAPAAAEEGLGACADRRALLGVRSGVDMGATGDVRDGQPRHVSFSTSPLDGVYDVTPYARKYGVHPSFFDFDRKGEMKLTEEGVLEDLRRTGECRQRLKLSGEAML
ncbi:unnamed protein product [Prorocentrum cordatum]|uniref:Uncharacterized protein n=1 Tax=Prorocentrum cordatum TaxID=2364126 RepID=A0ABN9SMV3_9DINO|nr:unnamed protein product [Polarella glacialis]